MSKGSAIRSELEALMRQRIVVIDGAMGTTIREYKAKGQLSEEIARGTRFAKNDKDLLNNGDILSITRAGCDRGHSPAVPGSRGGYH